MTREPTLGIVLIGRNEGARLVASLASIPVGVTRRVYVDSGSTDGSCEAARAAGAKVVELDLSRPFTAARARNEGLEALLQDGPVDLVQFIDGDCALQPGWLDTACAFLATRPGVAVACGRRRERFPERSLYNRLCDDEWNTPVGRAAACGGDALMRVAALRAVGGFDPSLIAGEEPDLCLRLRRAGWEIWRLDAEMTLHDAAMTRFGQWWQRCRRGGHAYAEAVAMHGASPERHGVRVMLHIIGWGMVLPALTLLGVVTFGPAALALLGLYPLQMLRQRLRGETWLRAIFLTLAKLPEAQGALTWAWRRLRGAQARLIEYK